MRRRKWYRWHHTRDSNGTSYHSSSPKQLLVFRVFIGNRVVKQRELREQLVEFQQRVVRRSKLGPVARRPSRILTCLV